MPNEQCPVCSNELNQAPTVSQRFDAKFYDCPQCGKYNLNEFAHVNPELHKNKLISAWIRLQNKRGKIIPFINDNFVEEDWFKNLGNMGFPQTVNEKMDTLLKTYADMVKDDYNEIIGVENHPELVSGIAAKDINEIYGLNRLLVELNYIESKSTPKIDRVRLTAKGWLRIDDISKSISTSDSAFIAMWYAPQTNKCREAIKEAVTACGYTPIIVDETEFNDFIMEEVIALIRQARFLIADLTCSPESVDAVSSKVTGGVRGGVYWEAGMAYGMGKTVIQTCKEDDCSLERIHFDLSQYTTIRWKDDNLTTGHIELYKHVDNPSFAQQLAQRIIVTMGKGSYTSSSD